MDIETIFTGVQVIIFAIGFLAGLLILNQFSFWKW